MTGRISRRRLLSWIALASGMAVTRAGAEQEKPSDRGIGGTGISADPNIQTSRALGFMGTIQRFGSIYVNGARITYPKDVPVRIDGRRRSASALALGQVVRTVAREEQGRLVTDRIEVVSEVIGPIGSLSDDTLVVLGQRVLLVGAERPSWWQPGARVRVSGVRTADGAIVGTYIAPAGNLPDQIVGVPVLQGWNLRIGGLPLLGIADHFAGWRVIVQGAPSAAGFRVAHVRLDAPFAGRDLSGISFETYIARRGSEFRSGAGIDFRDPQLDGAIGEHRNVHAVLRIDVDSAGGLRLDQLAIGGGDGSMPLSPGLAPGGRVLNRRPGMGGIVLSPAGPGNAALRGAVGLGGGVAGPGGPLGPSGPAALPGPIGPAGPPGFPAGPGGGLPGPGGPG